MLNKILNLFNLFGCFFLLCFFICFILIVCWLLLLEEFFVGKVDLCLFILLGKLK